MSSFLPEISIVKNISLGAGILTKEESRGVRCCNTGTAEAGQTYRNRERGRGRGEA